MWEGKASRYTRTVVTPPRSSPFCRQAVKMDPKPTTIHSGHLCFRGGGVRGAQGSGAGDLATRRSLLCPSALPSPALPCLSLPFLPALPCPACPACLTSEPLQGGKPTLFVERPAQATRTHNPTPIRLSYGLLCNVVVSVSNSERKQRARKPTLKGGLGVNPNP